MPTTAGHSVRFHQGTATVYRTEDLPYVLARPDARVMVTEYAMSWLPEVLDHTNKLAAEVSWPDDWSVDYRGVGDYEITPPPVPSIDVENEPDVKVEDPIDAALKGKPRWRKQPSN